MRRRDWLRRNIWLVLDEDIQSGMDHVRDRRSLLRGGSWLAADSVGYAQSRPNAGNLLQMSDRHGLQMDIPHSATKSRSRQDEWCCMAERLRFEDILVLPGRLDNAARWASSFA